MTQSKNIDLLKLAQSFKKQIEKQTNQKIKLSQVQEALSKSLGFSNFDHALKHSRLSLYDIGSHPDLLKNKKSILPFYDEFWLIHNNNKLLNNEKEYKERHQLKFIEDFNINDHLNKINHIVVVTPSDCLGFYFDDRETHSPELLVDLIKKLTKSMTPFVLLKNLTEKSQQKLQNTINTISVLDKKNFILFSDPKKLCLNFGYKQTPQELINNLIDVDLSMEIVEDGILMKNNLFLRSSYLMISATLNMNDKKDNFFDSLEKNYIENGNTEKLQQILFDLNLNFHYQIFKSNMKNHFISCAISALKHHYSSDIQLIIPTDSTINKKSV